jgi:hypothetical protein
MHRFRFLQNIRKNYRILQRPPHKPLITTTGEFKVGGSTILPHDIDEVSQEEEHMGTVRREQRKS